MLVTDSVKRLLRDHLFSFYLQILLAAFSVKLVLVVCIHKLDWVKVLHPTPHKICHLGDDDPKPMSWLGMETRRPASADRTACRQFQATGQPVSRMQASDTMTSRLPCYEVKCVQRRCFQWGSVPLRSDIKGTELPPTSILIPLERQLTALQLCHWQFLLWPPYVIGGPLYFCPVVSFYLSSSSIFFFPRLISAAGDWMSTILPHMVWP